MYYLCFENKGVDQLRLCFSHMHYYIYNFRSSSLAHVNAMLREQLDQATAANQSLTGDIHKLTADWQRAREDLELKENEWRDEEQVSILEIIVSLLEKTCLQGFRAGPTQTGLYSRRRWLEA